MTVSRGQSKREREREGGHSYKQTAELALHCIVPEVAKRVMRPKTFASYAAAEPRLCLTIALQLRTGPALRLLRWQRLAEGPEAAIIQTVQLSFNDRFTWYI